MTQMTRFACAVLCAATLVSLEFATSVDARQAGPQLRVLSSRPDLVSGGDALVRIDPGAGTSATGLKVTVNGTDVTSALKTERGSLIGLVTGLTNGANTLTVTGGGRTSSLTLVNHAVTGPLISAPQEQPFVCMTERFKLLSGGTLESHSMRIARSSRAWTMCIARPTGRICSRWPTPRVLRRTLRA